MIAPFYYTHGIFNIWHFNESARHQTKAGGFWEKFATGTRLLAKLLSVQFRIMVLYRALRLSLRAERSNPERTLGWRSGGAWRYLSIFKQWMPKAFSFRGNTKGNGVM